ncbi:hypothetical protein SKAU_G00314210 [Synaphobranchus kaupii]|uniref:Uncharacterized protein n=1 Tax=Synaphobranchus kaupii TaxID=118154 RepID=A0A9Q1ESD6_SYNKA|nr:hypothetical protein SKAU_G00314210 [Synaphobranchus kaupii]
MSFIHGRSSRLGPQDIGVTGGRPCDKRASFPCHPRCTWLRRPVRSRVDGERRLRSAAGRGQDLRFAFDVALLTCPWIPAKGKRSLFWCENQAPQSLNCEGGGAWGGGCSRSNRRDCVVRAASRCLFKPCGTPAEPRSRRAGLRYAPAGAPPSGGTPAREETRDVSAQTPPPPGYPAGLPAPGRLWQGRDPIPTRLWYMQRRRTRALARDDIRQRAPLVSFYNGRVRSRPRSRKLISAPH